MLSRSQPSDPVRAFSQEIFVGVLHVVLGWPEWLAEDGIASVLGSNCDTIKNIVAHFSSFFFKNTGWNGGIAIS